MNFSFHHFLLNKNNFFHDMISVIALLIIFIKSLTNLSIIFFVMSIFLSKEKERYFYNLFLYIFQFILIKLYDDCVNIVSFEMRSRMISIEKWLKIWLFFMIIWYFIILFIIYSLFYIKSIVIFLFENIIISNEIINCISYWSISAINSFIYWLYLWYYNEFYNE